jgi:hypothetical protein
MGDRSSGTDGIAFLYGDVGRSQAQNQVLNQLGKISRALLVAKSNSAKLRVWRMYKIEQLWKASIGIVFSFRSGTRSWVSGGNIFQTLTTTLLRCS